MKQKDIDLTINKQFLNKKFFITIISILIVGFFLLLYLLNLQEKNRDSKNQEILELLNWGIETFYKNYGKYPDSLQALDEKEIVKPIDLILNEKNRGDFIYKKSGTGFSLYLKSKKN